MISLAGTRQMKIEIVNALYFQLIFPSSHKSFDRLAGRTLNSRRIIHLAADDWRMQAKVHATHGGNWWACDVSFTICNF